MLNSSKIYKVIVLAQTNTLRFYNTNYYECEKNLTAGLIVDCYNRICTDTFEVALKNKWLKNKEELQILNFVINEA